MIPELKNSDAVFLDFDGTLVGIAPEPAAVVVGSELLDLLRGLHTGLGGALAIVTGRPLSDLDGHLAPLVLPAAGEHGAEMRISPDDQGLRAAELPELIGAAAEELAAKLPGTLLERKRASISMHYRQAPQHEAEIVAVLQAVVSGMPDYHLLKGKMVVELRPRNLDKGTAIRRFMDAPPFAGRRPVFVGDDTTDEDGFAVVNSMGGLSVRVGAEADTAASFVLADVRDVHNWLNKLA